MAGPSVDVAACVRLTNNEITFASAAPLVRRYVKDGCWQIDRLHKREMSALFAYACDPYGLDPEGCAEVIHRVAGLIGRDDDEIRARLRGLPLRTTMTKDDVQLAYRLVRRGVPESQLASAVRRAKLGLGDPRVKIIALLAEVGIKAYPYVSAYFDSPKSLEELQATANPDGSEDALMKAPDNLARIPKAKHWKLNSWYLTPNPEFGDLTPRQYLMGKSWDERRRVGLIGLRYIGVLK